MGTDTPGDDHRFPARTSILAASLLAAGVAACGRPISFSATDVAATPLLAGAPRGFFLGAATSAHQIEGGTHNDWTEWEKGSYPDGTPHVAGGASAARIADSWNLWRSDLAALQLIGADPYRPGGE